jgi:hypothetical protein
MNQRGMRAAAEKACLEVYNAEFANQRWFVPPRALVASSSSQRRSARHLRFDDHAALWRRPRHYTPGRMDRRERPSPCARQPRGATCRLPTPSRQRRLAPNLAIIQVWMERAGAERSLVIELMERPDVADAESAALHFDELASGNDALRSAIVNSQQLASKPERLGCDPPCFCLTGSQILVDGEGAECQLQVRTSTRPILSSLDAPRIPVLCCSRCSCLSPGLPRSRPTCLSRSPDRSPSPSRSRASRSPQKRRRRRTRHSRCPSSIVSRSETRGCLGRWRQEGFCVHSHAILASVIEEY